ncbi:MAG: hypothetical protein ABSF58_08085 [Solirubrobacteraceae bacterium]|jgi:hypothetical protein
MSRIRVVLASACVAFLLAGCGGESATAKFLARANAICVATNRQLGALATPGKAVVGTPAVLLAKQAALVAKEAPIDQSELQALRTVEAPAGERSAYADALAQARADVSLLPKIAAALRGKSNAALTSITQQSSALSDIAVAAMKRLGLRQCARNL